MSSTAALEIKEKMILFLKSYFQNYTGPLLSGMDGGGHRL